jgi:hypothetical protein
VSIVYVLLRISPASMCTVPTFRNHESVPSSKAGSRLCGVRKGEAICTVVGGLVGPMVSEAQVVGGSGWLGGCARGGYKRRGSGSRQVLA